MNKPTSERRHAFTRNHKLLICYQSPSLFLFPLPHHRGVRHHFVFISNGCCCLKFPTLVPKKKVRCVHQNLGFFSKILSDLIWFLSAMSQGTKWIRSLKQLSTAANISATILEKGQNRVMDASLTLIRERAKLKVIQLIKFISLCILRTSAWGFGILFVCSLEFLLF